MFFFIAVASPDRVNHGRTLPSPESVSTSFEARAASAAAEKNSGGIRGWPLKSLETGKEREGTGKKRTIARRFLNAFRPRFGRLRTQRWRRCAQALIGPQLRAKPPKLATLLAEAEADVLVFMSVPKERREPGGEVEVAAPGESRAVVIPDGAYDPANAALRA